MNQLLAIRFIALFTTFSISLVSLVAQENAPIPLSPSEHGGNPAMILDLRNTFPNGLNKAQVYDYSKLGGEIAKNFPTKRSCLTMESENARRIKEAGESLSDFESWLQNEVSLIKGQKGKEEIFTLPVVVHVIYSNEAENISFEQIKSQIEVLNQDYSRTNPDKEMTHKKFAKRAADTKIQFQLAKRDPQGRSTSGVNRVAVGGTPLSPEQVNNIIKPNTIWNPNEYLNIWVCNLEGGILGFSQFPSSSGLTGIPVASTAANTDGVVIHYQAFGTTGTALAPFNGGRTTTHEVGHWLGLLHIWGENEGCENDDFCQDTPPIGGPNFECTAKIATCDKSPVMNQNFMDYTADICMNLFTLDQKHRMRAVLQNSPRRNSLIRSRALQAPPVPPSADFVADMQYGCGGITVHFKDQSTNHPEKYTWVFEGGKPSTSNDPNPTVVYSSPGTYNVSLTVTNENGQNSLHEENYIKVVDQGLALPHYADFELAALPEGGQVLNPDRDTRWKRSRKFGGYGTSQGVMYFDNFNNYLRNSQDWLMLPILDFSKEKHPFLSFDLAYGAYSQKYSDTLGIFISTTCDGRFHAIYFKGGEKLATSKDIYWDVFKPSVDDWRTEAIDLSKYSGNSHVQIAFVNFSGVGNNIFIDNIKVESLPERKPEAAFQISKDRICAGEKITFSDISDYDPTSWKWSFPGASVASDTNKNPVVHYPQPGLYDVSLTVSNEAGQTTEFLKNVIEVLPGPDLQIIGPTTELCPGGKIELRATGGIDHHWSWDEEGGSASGPRITVSPFKNQTFLLTASASNGCKSSVSHHVALKAEDLMEVSPSQAIICQGESITLNASGASSYRWTPDIGLSHHSGSSIIARPDRNTIYTLIGERNGCEFRREVMIEVKEAPNNVRIEGLRSSICEGESLYLHASGASNFEWYPIEGLNTDKGANIVASPILSTNYSVLARNEYGCVSEWPFDIEVSPIPRVDIFTEREEVCRGENIRLRAQGAATYQWFSEDRLSDPYGEVVFAQPSFTTSYMVVGRNERGCADTAQTAIYVREPNPIHISTETTTLCPGDQTYLTVSGGENYKWSPATGLDRIYGSQVIAAPRNDTRYTLTSIDRFGCQTQQQIDIRIATNAPPRADFEIKKPFICVGEELQIEDHSVNAVQYFWVFPGGYPERTSERFPKVSYAQPGTYDIFLTVQGCDGSDRVEAKGAIRVSDPGFLQLEQQPEDLIICKGESLELVPRGAESYRWLPGPNMMRSRGPIVRVQPEESTEYVLIGKDYGGCEDTLSLYVEVRGIDNKLTIYPPIASICEGESVELFADGAEHYKWFPLNGLNNETGANILAAPQHSTIYSVEGIDRDGCVRYGEVEVGVKPTPRITVDVSENEICEGDEVRLIATGAASYQWAANVDIDLPIGNEILVKPSQRTIFSVRGINQEGCMGEASLEVEVHPKPAIFLQADKSNICAGDTAYVQMGGAIDYQWYPAEGVIVSTDREAYISPNANVSYHIKGKNQWGCEGENSLEFELAQPSPLSIFPDSIEICAGESVDLEVSGGSANYFWELEKGMSATTGRKITVKPSKTTTYMVRSYQPNMEGCVNTGSVTILVKEAVGIKLATSAGSLCQGEELALNARGATSTQLFKWDANGGSLGATRGMATELTDFSLDKPARQLPRTTTYYELIGTDVNGCKDTAAMEVEVVNFNAAFDESRRFIDLAETGGVVKFEDQTLGATKWKWTFGASVSQEKAPTHIFSMPGSYPIQLWVSNGECHKILEQSVEINNSSRLSDLKQLKVEAVNEAGRFSLRFNSTKKMYFDLKLLDGSGNTIVTDVLHIQAGDYERFFDLSNLPPATYNLVIFNGEDAQKFEMKVN